VKSICLLCLGLLLAGVAPVAAAEPLVKSLTLAECIQQALQRNLELQAERITPSISEWGVTREQGIYDPQLSGAISYSEATSLLDAERAVALGLGTLDSENLTARLALGGLLPSGATYELSARENRESGTLNKEFVYTGGTTLRLTQPLLKNAGFGNTSAGIRLARLDHTISRETFLRRVMDIITAVNHAYYELGFTIAEAAAKREDLLRAQSLLADNRKRLELGVLSQLDVTQAEAGAAEREEAVVLADRAIRDAENNLKRLITDDLAELAGFALVPADPPAVVATDLDVARSTRAALEQRPEYASAKAACDQLDIRVRYHRNQLWPQVDLTGVYGWNARSPFGGNTNNLTSSFDDFAGNLVDSDAPVWSVGVTVTIPLGNRQARANYRIARLDANQALINLKRIEQDIVLEVDNAVGRVRTNLQRIEATRVAARLAEESLRSEEQRLRAGTSTSFLVLAAQAQLANARSAAIRAQADYAKSLATLDRAEGATLLRHNIRLADEP
jgi:outer membrane protein TolC